MTEFLQSISLFPLLLSLGTFQIGVWCQKKTKLAICNPLLIATVLSIGVLLLTDFDLQVYQSGSSWISFRSTAQIPWISLPRISHIVTSVR